MSSAGAGSSMPESSQGHEERKEVPPEEAYELIKSQVNKSNSNSITIGECTFTIKTDDNPNLIPINGHHGVIEYIPGYLTESIYGYHPTSGLSASSEFPENRQDWDLKGYTFWFVLHLPNETHPGHPTPFWVKQSQLPKQSLITWTLYRLEQTYVSEQAKAIRDGKLRDIPEQTEVEKAWKAYHESLDKNLVPLRETHNLNTLLDLTKPLFQDDFELPKTDPSSFPYRTLTQSEIDNWKLDLSYQMPTNSQNQTHLLIANGKKGDLSARESLGAYLKKWRPGWVGLLYVGDDSSLKMLWACDLHLLSIPLLSYRGTPFFDRYSFIQTGSAEVPQYSLQQTTKVLVDPKPDTLGALVNQLYHHYQVEFAKHLETYSGWMSLPQEGGDPDLETSFRAYQVAKEGYLKLKDSLRY